MAPSPASESALPAFVPGESTLIEPGRVLFGRYEIHSRLGEGGMGHVFRAWHLDLDIPIAIKLLKPELVRDPAMLARFLDEARSMAAIRSESIVRVYDVARFPDGTPYLVLELVEGPDLEQFLAVHRSLSSADAIELALDVCAALRIAHANGIVHRDIKPENLLVERRLDGSRHLKVSDFGIAKRTEPDRRRRATRPMETVGSPSYMAPEQLQNAVDIDGRADIWSLGVVLFQMVTGELPFEGTTAAEVASRVFSQRAVSPRCHRRTIPVGLERVIARCLERNRDDRYADVLALARDLASVAIPIGVESARVGDVDVSFAEDSAPADSTRSRIVTRRLGSGERARAPRPSPRPALRLDAEPPRRRPRARSGWRLLLGALTIAVVLVGLPTMPTIRPLAFRAARVFAGLEPLGHDASARRNSPH